MSLTIVDHMATASQLLPRTCPPTSALSTSTAKPAGRAALLAGVPPPRGCQGRRRLPGNSPGQRGMMAARGRAFRALPLHFAAGPAPARRAGPCRWGSRPLWRRHPCPPRGHLRERTAGGGAAARGHCRIISPPLLIPARFFAALPAGAAGARRRSWLASLPGRRPGVFRCRRRLLSSRARDPHASAAGAGKARGRRTAGPGVQAARHRRDARPIPDAPRRLANRKADTRAAAPRVHCGPARQSRSKRIKYAVENARAAQHAL